MRKEPVSQPGPEKTGRLPERRCVLCGQHFPKRELLRVTRGEDGGVRIDRTGKAGGRGAYLCGSETCRTAFLQASGLDPNGKPFGNRPRKSGKLERALRLSARIPDEQMIEIAEAAARKGTEAALSKE